jgi:hypothetical protein
MRRMWLCLCETAWSRKASSSCEPFKGLCAKVNGFAEKSNVV